MPQDWSTVGQTLLSVPARVARTIEYRGQARVLLGLFRQRENKQHGRGLRQMALAFRVQRRHVTLDIGAAARGDGNELPPSHRKTDRRGNDFASRVEGPQFLSRFCIEG